MVYGPNLIAHLVLKQKDGKRWRENIRLRTFTSRQRPGRLLIAVYLVISI